MDGRIVDVDAAAEGGAHGGRAGVALGPSGAVAPSSLPSSSVALFASAAPRRVTPEALRRSLRRRGFLDLSVFAACFGAALALSSLFDHGALGWRSLVYVALLMLPAVILHRLPPQRCPACATALEASTLAGGDDGLPLSVTFCPHCEVGVE